MLDTKWVIDVDIKAFFGQIFYQWILNNFPMPSGTKNKILGLPLPCND
jgi:hypothetical protein